MARKLTTPDKHAPRGIHQKLLVAVSAECARTSRYSVAKRAGLPTTTISRFITQERGISLEIAAKIAEAIGFDLLPAGE